jgi:5'(3')-deoxyribonucleotidase
MSRRILFDLDSVIADMLPAVCLWYNRTYNNIHPPITPETFHCWGMHLCVPINTEIYSFFKTPFYEETLPMKDSIHVLSRLHSQGDSVIIVTKSFQPKGVLPWVEKHLKDVVDDVIILKSTVKKNTIGGDFLFDDKPENLIGGSWEPYLYTQPHNTTETRFPRVRSWREIARVLDVEDTTSSTEVVL